MTAASSSKAFGRLDAHARAQHQPRHRNRRQVILDSGIGEGGHRGVFLGAEVLHDHFLDMPELLVRLANRM
ncbi:Uncharacterised protein [Mycobacterium tuberculosis]|nr:Uncharacterised protein [Mycobacterium tuberculosis]